MSEVYLIKHYVIKFVSGFLQVLRFPPPIKLTPRYNWNIVESRFKPHNPNTGHNFRLVEAVQYLVEIWHVVFFLHSMRYALRWFLCLFDICVKCQAYDAGIFFFFISLTDFSYFPRCKLFSKSCWTQSDQVKHDHFERGCRWIQLFFNDFSYFIF